MTAPNLQPFPEQWADAVNSAKGLCESEANRWDEMNPETAEHWRSVATRLGGIYLTQDLIGVGHLILVAPDLLDALRMVLPLAEEYLKKAPGHPDNAKLETARAVLRKAAGR